MTLKQYEDFQYEIYSGEPIKARGRFADGTFEFYSRFDNWTFRAEGGAESRQEIFEIKSENFLSLNKQFVELTIEQTVYLIDACMHFYLMCLREAPKVK